MKKQNRTMVGAATAAMALTLLLSNPLYAKEYSKIKAAAVGVNSAAATIHSLINKKSKLNVKLKGLSPSTEYNLLIGEISRATFTSNPRGAANLRFSQPAQGRSLPLNFDPRGRSLAVTEGTGEMLNVVLSGEGEPEDIEVVEYTDLTPKPLAGSGEAHAKYRSKEGEARFEVEVEGVPDGDYPLYVAGSSEGTIRVVGGEGEIEFESDADEEEESESEDDGAMALDFDPRRKIVEIFHQGADSLELYFSSKMIAQAENINVCDPHETELDLASTGADEDAEAEVQEKLKADCEREFEVEVVNLPMGDYEVVIGGETYKINVPVDGAEASIEFSSDPEGSDEFLFDFEIADQSIEIRQGDVVYFSNTLPDQGDDPSSVADLCEPLEIELPLLLSEGLSEEVFDDAEGEVSFSQDDDCEQEFEVEIEGVPEGTYRLFVGDAFQGEIAAVLVDDETEGELELEGFDPRGQTIEVRQVDDTVVFSRVFLAP